MTIAPESGCMDAEVAGHGSGKMIDRSLGEAIALSLTDGALPGETDGLDDAARAEAAAFVAATAAEPSHAISARSVATDAPSALGM